MRRPAKSGLGERDESTALGATTPPLDLFAGVVPFVVATDRRSVRGAARELGVTPSAVSKAIAGLEARLGVTLLQRTARAIRPTPEGEAIASQYRDAVARGLAARDIALSAQHRPQGLLRVSLSRVLGRALVAPALPRFAARYPELSLRLVVTDELLGFAEHGLDVAVRIGSLDDSSAQARRLAETRWCTVASPAYLARHSAPASPGDLARHLCLRFVSPNGRARDWTFAALHVAVAGPLEADDGEALVAAAEAGVGIVQAMDFMVARSIAEGRLVEVLADHATTGPTIWAMTAPRRHRSPRVRAFVGFLAELFARDLVARRNP
jgi:LysR family transcriptional regulator, regulator for bpeEF and oprC